MLSIVGLIVAFCLIFILTMRGYHILLVAVICATIVALTGGLNVYQSLMGPYMTAYVGFFKDYFLLFLMGTLFGKVMEESKAASAIASWVIRRFGAKRTLLAVVLACGILCYGGISVFVVGFTVYPIAIKMFKEADLPRRMLPAALVFGSGTFAMTSPGTPSIHNIVPTQTLGTSTMAATVVGMVMFLVTLILGMAWLERYVAKAVKNGEHFELRAGEDFDFENTPAPVGETSKDITAVTAEKRRIPSAGLSILPLLVCIVLLNLFKLPVEIAVGSGFTLAFLLFRPTLKSTNFSTLFSNGVAAAVMALSNTCSFVGFGGVVRAVPAWEIIVNAVTSIPGPPLVGAAVGTTVVAGIAGSASGALAVVVPLLGPVFLERGVAAAALHRTMAAASSVFDSMPHNGHIVTTLNGICKVTHKEGYYPIFVTCLVVTGISCTLGIILFTLFPNLP